MHMVTESTLTNQEASINLLSLSIRGQTEWKPQLQKTKLITWITALSNSAMPCRATQHGQVMVESSDKMWSTGEGNGKPFQYSCLENPMNSKKRQTDRTLKDELPRSEGAQYATGESGEIAQQRMKRLSQSKNSTQMWKWLVMEGK